MLIVEYVSFLCVSRCCLGLNQIYRLQASDVFEHGSSVIVFLIETRVRTVPPTGQLRLSVVICEQLNEETYEHVNESGLKNVVIMQYLYTCNNKLKQTSFRSMIQYETISTVVADRKNELYIRTIWCEPLGFTVCMKKELHIHIIKQGAINCKNKHSTCYNS